MIAGSKLYNLKTSLTIRRLQSLPRLGAKSTPITCSRTDPYRTINPFPHTTQIQQQNHLSISSIIPSNSPSPLHPHTSPPHNQFLCCHTAQRWPTQRPTTLLLSNLLTSTEFISSMSTVCILITQILPQHGRIPRLRACISAQESVAAMIIMRNGKAAAVIREGCGDRS